MIFVWIILGFVIAICLAHFLLPDDLGEKPIPPPTPPPPPPRED